MFISLGGEPQKMRALTLLLVRIPLKYVPNYAFTFDS